MYDTVERCFEFQFQYGAIKSLLRSRSLRRYFRYFNSNMVRLKVFYVPIDYVVEAYFNSNMVRLKGRHFGRTVHPLPTFQFQYGAIKSIKGPTTTPTSSIFQFQYGAIKRTLTICKKPRVRKFQFQYGAIKRPWK